MSIQKCISSNPYFSQGGAFTHTNKSVTSGFVQRRYATAGLQSTKFNPSGFITLWKDQGLPAWSTPSGGWVVDSTGSVLFTNINQGGCLEEVIVVNRGGTPMYVGFNSTTPAVNSGFLVGSGESIEHFGFISAIWAIAAVNTTTTVAAQGMFKHYFLEV